MTIKTCKNCNKPFYIAAGADKKYCSLKCARFQRDEKHWNWKGDKAGYGALHDWVQSRRGTPSRCEHCGTTDATRYEWANKSKKYKRDLNDWIRLCRSCHIKYDDLSIRQSKLSKEEIILARLLKATSYLSYKRIGEIFKIAKSTAICIIKGDHCNSIYMPKHDKNKCPICSKRETGLRHARGSKCKHSKLTEKQVRIIKYCINFNMTNTEIAQYFPVARDSISLIRHSRQWKHVII